jgi:hypothetical protein
MVSHRPTVSLARQALSPCHTLSLSEVHGRAEEGATRW